MIWRSIVTDSFNFYTQILQCYARKQASIATCNCEDAGITALLGLGFNFPDENTNIEIYSKETTVTILFSSHPPKKVLVTKGDQSSCIQSETSAFLQELCHASNKFP